MRVTIEVTERFINHIKHLTTDLLLAKHLTTLGVHRMQVVAFHNHLGYLLVLLGHIALRHYQLELYIVVVFFPTT